MLKNQEYTKIKETIEKIAIKIGIFSLFVWKAQLAFQKAQKIFGVRFYTETYRPTTINTE